MSIIGIETTDTNNIGEEGSFTEDEEEKGYTEASSIMDEGEKIPKKETLFGFNTHSKCVICPPSASLKDPEHKVFLSTEREEADMMITMTCGDAEVSGRLGIMTEQNCSIIKSGCSFAWSSLEGENGEEAKAIIQEEIPSNMKISIIEGQFSSVAADYQKDRIRIFVDRDWNVIGAPQIG